MKKTFLVGVVATISIGGLVSSYYSATSPAAAPPVSASSISVAGQTAGATNSAAAAGRDISVLSIPPEPTIAINPYAAGLRGPGRSKRDWDAGFIGSFALARTGEPVRFELTGGVMAEGTVKIIQVVDGKVTYVSGELTAPETGKFFFLTPPVGGKAGNAVGVVEFPSSLTAYRIEPTGPNGDPELWQRRLDEVVCVNLPKREAAADLELTNVTESITPLRPDLVPEYVPSYNSNVVSLQSYPRSPAVLLLDFFGGYTPTWGGVAYARPPVDNNTIKDIWKRIAEDFMPFNINVTTDLKVFQAAAEGSRQRCCFTTTPITAAGVAYFGSWNWGGDTPCWSVYYVGKAAAEVGAHEPGHTLGLAHQGQNPSSEYYGGQGSGATGWAPIMGVGYYQPVATWAKGEYQNANQQQDELQTITTANNNVHYRTDDTGITLASSRYLEIYSNNTASAEGVIERTDDTDAFQFTTAGGVMNLTANVVGDWSDLAVVATLADDTDTIVASNNPQTVLSATITTNLPAGTYTFRVTGAGRNNPLTDGFTSYGSLGYYSVTGSIAGARPPTRLSVVEHATNNTVVGSILAGNSNSSPLSYAISSGNTGGTFSVDDSGVVRVANNLLLDYYRLATNQMYAVQFELFVNITNLNDSALTELSRRVVIAVQKFYPPVPAAVVATVDTSLRINISWIGGQEATSYNVKRATTPSGPYTIVANRTETSYTDAGLTNGVRYYYVVSAVNSNAESANSAEVSVVAQAVANFGFEIPSIGGGNYSYNPSGGFWTFGGAAGSGSGLIANGSGFSNPNAPEGAQAAFVQSYGTISQTLSGFTPGVSYTILYSAAQRQSQDQHGGESWDVVIDGNVIKNNVPGSTTYTTYTATFTASATTHTLSFVGTDLAGGDNTVFIDNVRFSPVLQPVPAAVVLTSPTNNTAFVAAAPVNLTALVTTNGNLINHVQFYGENFTLLGQITNAPYVCAWANLSAGKHSAFARVQFNNGSFADSASVSFVVINRDPNFSFEIPGLGSGNYNYTSKGAAWTFADQHDGSGAGIVANGSAFGNFNAPAGTQAAFLQAYGSFSQTLTGFIPGTNYTITYSAAQRSGSAQHGGESWDVALDGVVIKTNNPGSTSYTTYTATFTASDPTHTIAFVGTDLVGGDNTVFLDKVSFTPPLLPSLTPDLTTDTLPVTALDVVGSQISFSAAFTSTNLISYQWQKIVGGLLMELPGATNTSLTLSNLQLADTASYRLQASNAFGIAVSSASTLTVSNLPPALNSIITAYAAQTGLGSAATNFVPTWTVTPGSLIVGQTPSSVGSGNFNQNIALLSDSSFGYLNFWPNVGGSPTEVNGGSSAGQSVTYSLGNATSGYSISNIVVYGGWGDAGRDQQAYTVSYSTVTDPTTFIILTSVDFNPANPNGVQSATRATIGSATAGPLVTNAAAVKFDFTTPAPENGYCGYAEIAIYATSLNPAVAQNPSPVTANDVVGSEVTFTAAFTGVTPLSYQWQKVSGGVTNNVAGATNETLTLTNLQFANTGNYLLRASNAYGVAVSAPTTLTVSSVPVAVNNVVAALAAQTGTGSGTFTPTWTVLTNNSLIAGKSPSSSSGNFSLEVAGRSVSFLTDGGDNELTQINGNSGATTSANYVTCGNGNGAGATAVYSLTDSATGYTLTNITVYGGWKDAGRDQQAYTVYYSKVSAPTTFLLLRNVNYNPANPAGAQSATRTTLRPASGVLATNVAAVKFDFTTPASENGYCGYTEIGVFGTMTIPPAVPASLSAANPPGTSSFVMSISDLVVGRNYMLQSTTNLPAASWFTELNFVATQSTASFTNSTTAAQKFFRIVGY